MKQEKAEINITIFTKLNCNICKFDNEDSDPTCEILQKIIEHKKEIKKIECEKYKNRRVWK